MESLPDEVLSDIFIRLLAKQLAQMRSVCKSWNGLLSESSFVKSHLHRSMHNNDNILLFFDWGCCPSAARPSRSPHLELTNFIKLPDHLRYKDSFGGVLGSVNGLICFINGSCDGDNVLHIWNPSLSAVLTLPPCFSPFNFFPSFGFGYDPKTDDYKVVELSDLFLAANMVTGAVYSMRKGSWESISQTFPSPIKSISGQNQVCIDGHLHWLAHPPPHTDSWWKGDMIVALDLGEETFHQIPLPYSIIHRYRSIKLGALAGKLCVMSTIKGGICEVWVMNEYGVPESWVKHHVFSQFSGTIIPYGFTSHGEFLFKVNEDDNRFGLFDPIASKTKFFWIKMRKHYIGRAIEYVDSLVWIAPTNQLEI